MNADNRRKIKNNLNTITIDSTWSNIDKYCDLNKKTDIDILDISTYKIVSEYFQKFYVFV